MAGTPTPSRIESIFHPSDFSDGSAVAFAHALKIALVARAELNVLHVSESGGGHWSDFPGVRQTLEQWHVLPPNSPRSAVPSLGISVKKVLTQSDDPVAASVGYLERNPTDLVVLATHQHDGRARWLTRSVAQPIAQQSHLMTLFIPFGLPGFVSRTDGSVTLRSVIIPAAADPKPDRAIDAACLLASVLEPDPVTFTTVHVGDAGATPAPTVEQRDGWTWNHLPRSGEPVETILAVAGEQGADLIVMTTKGRHGFLDALRGSTTEQVLRHARCPVLALPVT